MHYLKRFLFAVVLLCGLVGSASAKIPMGEGWDTSTCNPTLFPLTETLPEGGSAAWVCKNPSNGRRTCGYSFSSPGYGADYYFASKCTQPSTGEVCPPHSTGVGNECVCVQGYVELNGHCVLPNEACQAKAGTSEIVNVTSGWQRTPSVKSNEEWVYTYRLRPAGTGSVCNAGCAQNFDAKEACPECGAYVSQVPNAQGLYRVSTDFKGHYSGTACTESADDQAIKPDDTKDPPCPGFVGEVNGVKGCYGTAEKPIRPVQTDPNLDTGDKGKGNPSAGTKPSSGEGSGDGGEGRTPTTGAGGSQGGPAGATGGTKPNGTTTKPGEGKAQQNCGAPGQPKCSIDETGTPKNWGDDKHDSKLGDYKEKAGAALGQIKESGGDTFNPFKEFFFAPPLAACESFVLPNDQGEITRHCEVVEGVRSIMAWVWALAALWVCLGWIKKATA